MWSVAASRKQNSRPDPAPTRWSYRMNRLMLTPLFRRFLFRALPALVVAGGAGLWLAQPQTQDMIAERTNALRGAIESRPEFAVKAISVTGASPALDRDIRRILPVHVPVSQFDLDLEDMHDTVTALHAVENASLRIRSGGVLEVAVTERQPVAVWRGAKGLSLLDASGTFTGSVETRASRPDLPLIVGLGADQQITEAQALLASAGGFGQRVRALVRIGDRRWDVVLDSGQRLLLPAADPIPALDRIVALAQATDLMERDFAVIDLRVPRRPTLRMTPHATTALRDARLAVTKDQ